MLNSDKSYFDCFARRLVSNEFHELTICQRFQQFNNMADNNDRHHDMEGNDLHANKPRQKKQSEKTSTRILLCIGEECFDLILTGTIFVLPSF